MKILLIRRDNIGDLVCTTPMFSALRQHYPDAHIAALVNSYNADVLTGNPDLDAVHVYTKAKHRESGQSVLGVYFDRLRLIQKLRAERYDYAIIAGAHFLPRALRFARLVAPRHVIGFTEAGKRGVQHIDMGIPYTLPQAMHEVEDIFRLLGPLGIKGPPGPQVLTPPPEETRKAEDIANSMAGDLTVGLHISARKPLQRWSKESFAELARQLATHYGARMLLFWSPGSADNPLHPGDDAKAAWIVENAKDLPLAPFPTQRLAELMGGLAACDCVICSDGGAMHIAAGLGKPIICFFGNSDATRWHPWGVPYELLQPPSHDVADIEVKAVIEAFQRLQERADRRCR